MNGCPPILGVSDPSPPRPHYFPKTVKL
uniref:Uncharacterized protein n=1 Tax=Anguilla anguilla TaxID=7936 RepID=A0A0E9T5Q2_ANGAN